MADECLSDSMYVAVDYQESVTASQTSAFRQTNKYEALTNVAKERSNYQQLNVESNSVKYPDSKHLLKEIKHQLRCTKVVASIGVIATVCLLFVASAAITLAVHTATVNESTNYLDQIKAVVNSTLGSKSSMNVFQNCFQEKRSCDIMHELSGRLTCNTENLPSKKKVNLHNNYCHSLACHILYT